MVVPRPPSGQEHFRSEAKRVFRKSFQEALFPWEQVLLLEYVSACPVAAADPSPVIPGPIPSGAYMNSEGKDFHEQHPEPEGEQAWAVKRVVHKGEWQ